MDKVLIAVQYDIPKHLKGRNNSVKSLVLLGNGEVPARHASFHEFLLQSRMVHVPRGLK